MEKSESRSPIYRYTESDKRDFEGASGEASIEEITDHVEKHIGEIHKVFHELISDQVHIDVHWVKPSLERPFHTLVTSGMSDKPMNTPEEVEGCDFAELSICLPSDWKISEEDFKEEKNYWPMRWLKYLARFPHEFNTWLSYGHTIPNGDPAEPFSDNTQLSTMLLLPTIVFGEDFRTLRLKNKAIDFYTLIPIYSEELNLKMKKGVEALFDGFDKFGVSDIVQVDRPNSVKKRKLFGLF
ncbi:suppressor of fused domain protein [Snuella sedimenti]|uniref:Suppressor of fused domain protein n=1 Tax=Snuella sedimenti TaxID=2798802 RepID=A0A8J7LM89_9FLAO|nr:suppressor of fused domain protein [Snuella sedimenti]MBJ6367224.1 suppressor of fused domain protein [Snuella sedimenti]